MLATVHANTLARGTRRYGPLRPPLPRPCPRAPHALASRNAKSSASHRELIRLPAFASGAVIPPQRTEGMPAPTCLSTLGRPPSNPDPEPTLTSPEWSIDSASSHPFSSDSKKARWR
jgi:hypothetical protein